MMLFTGWLCVANRPLCTLSLQVIRQLQQNKMLPAIWFILSRRDCDQSAINSNVVLVNKDEEAELVEELQQL